jgi:hypothetical protein
MGGCLLSLFCWRADNGWDHLGIPTTYLQAEAAVQGKTVAVATGAIDEEVEGLFTIDFLTGDLQCFALYVKSPAADKIGGCFGRNVLADLGVDKAKKPEFLLVTGRANFPRGTAGARPGFSVVYVIDDTTGRFAAYTVPWDKTKAVRGVPQKDALVLLGKGTARTARLREEP